MADRNLPFRPPGFLVGAVREVADAEGLDALLGPQRLRPAALARLRELGLLDRLPPQVRERWEREHRATLARNARHLAALEELAASLPSGGPPVVLLKGAAALAGLHQDAGVRPMKDLDLLAPGRAADTLAGVLCRLGYAADESGPEARRDRELGRAVFRRAGLEVEVHRRLAWALVSLDPSGIVGRSRPCDGPLAGLAGLRVPAPEDVLLYGAVHWVNHWRSATYALWPWELAEGLRRRAPDPDVLVEEARRHGLEACMHHVLGELRDTWRAPVPEGLTSRLRPPGLLRLALEATRGRPGLQSLLLMDPLRVLFPPAPRLLSRYEDAPSLLQARLRYAAELAFRLRHLLAGRRG